MIPAEIAIPAIGVLTGTFGRAEPEALAAVIVRWHHVHSPHEWAPIKLGDFVDFLRDDVVCNTWGKNPIWCRAFLHGMHPILEGGFVEGWVAGDAESVGQVTDAFVAALDNSHWDRRGQPNPFLPGGTCRACGCTDDRPCDEGCHWIEADLCSSCEEVGRG